jgi:chitinase
MTSISMAVALFTAAIPLSRFAISQVPMSVGTIETYGQMPLSAMNWNAVSHLVQVGAIVTPDGALDVTNLSGYAIDGPGTFVNITHAHGKKALFMINGTDAAFTNATDGAHLPAFAGQIVSVVNTYGYDGVEIDWEPPSSYTSAQEVQFHNLLVALRQPGNLAAPRLLAADTKSSTVFYGSHIAYFDWLDIMTYDNVGVYNRITWHNAPLDGDEPYEGSTVASIMRRFTDAGIPPARLNVGLPFYGYVWTGACRFWCWSGLTGPLQTWISGTPSLTFRQYFELAKNYGNPPGTTLGSYQWDGAARVPYLSVVDPGNVYNSQFVTYDDAQSITAKIQWAKANGFGWFIWTINYAYSPASGVTDNALLNAVANAWFGPGATP